MSKHDTPITPAMLEAADRLFENWLIENSDAVRENGGVGDTHSLFAALWELWRNQRKSSREISSAAIN